MSKSSADIKNTGKCPEFETMFKQYYPRLCNYASRFVRDREMAADIVQECFMRFYEKRYDVVDISLPSMLFIMVRNACINNLKHSALYEMQSISYLDNLGGEERLYHVDFAISPEEKLLYEELKEQISKAIDTLPEKCRQVFLMSRFEGLKNKEIADRIQTTTQNVSRHLSKALSRLSEYFKNNNLADSYFILMVWMLQKYMNT